MFSSQPGDLCAQVLELVKLIPDLSAQLLDLRKRHINDFVKPNEQNSSSLEYSAMARIFVQASAIELAHIAERSRKSQSKFSCKRAQSRTIALSQMSKIEFTRILPWRAIALLRTCSGYAECSRKSRRSGTTPQDMPQTSIPHCISANSCDRTGRHFTHWKRFVSIRAIRGHKNRFEAIK